MLLCQEYTVHRNELLGRVGTICKSYGVHFNTLSNDELLLLLLYGNDAFNESSNEDILPQQSFTSTLQTDGLVIFSCSEFFFYLNFFIIFLLILLIFLSLIYSICLFFEFIYIYIYFMKEKANYLNLVYIYYAPYEPLYTFNTLI